MAPKTKLRRSLGMWSIVGLGLGYMTPTVVFDTFGIVSQKTDGVVPLTYLVALTVMLFTAISYGKMVQIFPNAGSAYTYTKETMAHGIGFLVGWAALMDYLLLPLVNAVIIRIYMTSIFPDVPAWVWVAIYVSAVTAINVWSMGKTSLLNMFLVTYNVILIGVFLLLAWTRLEQGMGHGTILTLEPLYHAHLDWPAVFGGATILAFSFIGFDAITMYTEEAVDEKTVPRAIILTTLIGGGIFFVSSYFAQSLFPTVAHFEVVDDVLPEIGLYTGGEIFKLIFISGAFAATSASGLASHSSVARLLYVMGRNGVLPRRLFGYVHPRFQTPAFNVILVGVVSLLAVTPSLELISSLINFGALISFTFVNLSVIAHFVVRKGQYKTPHDCCKYLLMPMIGAGLTGILWTYLSADALIGGASWLLLGIIYSAFLTHLFRKPLPDFGTDCPSNTPECSQAVS